MVLNNVILSTPIVCIVLVIINILIYALLCNIHTNALMSLICVRIYWSGKYSSSFLFHDSLKKGPRITDLIFVFVLVLNGYFPSFFCVVYFQFNNGAPYSDKSFLSNSEFPNPGFSPLIPPFSSLLQKSM